MRIHIILFLAICGLLPLNAQEKCFKRFTKIFELDSVTLLRNPAMGWMLYEEGASFEPKSKNYDPNISIQTCSGIPARRWFLISQFERQNIFNRSGDILRNIKITATIIQTAIFFPIQKNFWLAHGTFKNKQDFFIGIKIRYRKFSSIPTYANVW